MHATREWEDGSPHPRPVVLQWDAAQPLNPAGLLMAYEEEAVLPVVSDMDAFLVGSRGVRLQPLQPEQACGTPTQ